MWRLPTLSMLTSFCKAWLACSPAIDPIVLFIPALTSGWWPPLSICNRVAQLFHTTLDYFCYFIHVSPPRISASIHDFPALLWHPSYRWVQECGILGISNCPDGHACLLNRLQRWYTIISSSDQWCLTIENHRYQWLICKTSMVMVQG